MKAVWSVEQIQRAEAALIDILGSDAVMQRAAWGLAVHCGRMLRRRYGARVVVLVGSGNNGGDALYAGVRLLGDGAAVHAVLLNPERAHQAAVTAFTAAGGSVGGAGDGPARVRAADLVVDGITGIGGHGALREEAATLTAAARGPIVAVDVPSGVDSDTGAVAGAAVRATCTVTFAGLKPGLVIGQGAVCSGAVTVVDIGLGPHLASPVAQVLEDADVAARLPAPRPDDDKYGQGVVGVVSGSSAYAGAAVLSVGGAVRAKSGLVRYVGSAAQGVRARWPEAIVTEGRPSEAGQVQAWVIGPGLGTDGRAHGLVREVLGTDLPVLVDADALTVLAQAPELVRDRAAPTVLTPHDREFARVFGEPGADRLGAAVRAAGDIGATVVLKGSATVIAGPDGQAFVNPTGTGWLASAGTGDVLSGLTAALLAAGGDPTEAAAVGAYLHGLAGRLAAGTDDAVSTSHGAPIIAMDVVDALPAAIRALRGAPRKVVSGNASQATRFH